MSGSPRTVRYEGLYPSQVRERFEQDAADAAVDDWYPASESWQGGILYVTYEHDPERRGRVPTLAPHASAPASVHAASPGSTSVPESMPPVRRAMPQWQRAALAIVAALGVMGTAAVTLLGFSGWDRPGTAPGNPVRQSTPGPGGLGPRADAVTFLESIGFVGVVSPVGDGQEHWLGRGTLGSDAELLGPAAGLLRATLTVFPTQDVGVGEVAQPTDVLRFLDRFAPGSDAWATAHTDDAVAARGVPVRQRFGDRILAISALDAEDRSVFTYAVTQVDAPARSRRTPRPDDPARTFGDGTWEVGTEVRPGTYRAIAEGDCTWVRLGDAAGGLETVVGSAVGSGSRLVTVGRKDVAIRSSGCGRWTSDLSRVTQDRTAFADGTFLVGEDVAAGAYVSSGAGPCTWARLSGFGGTPDEVIATGGGPGSQEVTIRASDDGFSSVGCGGWTRR